jgi:LmbE family N-acetylglucosaminyl deacetylase
MRRLMSDVLYVSPHADDVAFSAAGQLARDVGAGARVTVLTLFTPPEDRDAATGSRASFADRAARRGEDEAFARAFGAELAWGPWMDAIVRRRRYRTPQQLFSPLARDEAPLVEAVRAELQTRVDAGCTRVVAPLGVGGHVDHQVTHAAVAQLTGAAIEYYEDTPYVLTPYQLPRRFARIDATVEPRRRDGDATLARGSVRAELRAAHATWMNAPLVQASVGPRLRRLAVAMVLTPELTRWPRRSLPRARRFVPAILAAPSLAETKLRAVACYPSQWKLFYRTLDDWRAALEAYARAMGQPAIAERSWHASTHDHVNI